MAKKSIEEKVEDIFKKQLDNYHIKYYTKTESINDSIDDALKNYASKSGGSGNNYPDLRVLLETVNNRRIPVMIEVKGLQDKLIKFNKEGEIELVTTWDKDGKQRKDGSWTHKAGDKKYTTIETYAVNGAVHYANAILDGKSYDEVIAIGLNGVTSKDGSIITEIGAYYVSEKNKRIPKKIGDYTDLSFLKNNNLDRLTDILDKLVLSDAELDALTKKVEATLEEKIKSIHQRLYHDERLKTVLTTNEKLYLFCGLIMAGLQNEGVTSLKDTDLTGNNNSTLNDGVIILNHINVFLNSKKCSSDKIKMITGLLSSVFEKSALYKPHNGESILKSLYRQIKTEIIPCLESNLHLDFTGKILNCLGDWVHIENDKENDVVLTPRYVTQLMVKMARTNKDSFVWDRAMGSAGFLVSAMDIMIKDAKAKIVDKVELEEKIKSIKSNQLLGIEILGNIYILAVLNMILMGDGSSNIINGDSFKYNGNFPANVFLLNPPYSAEGKGFNFVEVALAQMHSGYACILIKESAGSGKGHPYTKRILQNNTLLASIHMSDIFSGKASVQTAIYVFKVNRPHEKDDIVTFIDFSNDGYTRQNRKKSSQEVNLKDTDNAIDRYAEVEAIVLGKKPKTNYYTEANGLLIKDTISLEGNDWTFAQHKPINTLPTEDDFINAVSNYLEWKVSQILARE